MLYEKDADQKGHLYFSKYEDEKTSYTPLPHYHSSIEIFIVTSGEYFININGEERILKAGEVAFIDSFTPHTSGSSEWTRGSSVYVIVASGDYLVGIDWLGKESLSEFTERRDGFEKIEALLELAYGMRGAMNDDMKAGFVRLLFGMLYEYSDRRLSTRGKTTEMAVEIMKYIAESYKEQITLDTLSAHFGYERTYLSRIVNQSLNMNLREYLNRIRIYELKRVRSENPTLPLFEAARACGFKSENTFYRALKKYG
ncbi:MAG: helix-turn-helix domain-containing protein [Clostridia bacterium]|nr:helix-turn-helix domain-containing protein [Clostridia bacterium]